MTPFSILVVDDDKALRMSLIELLEAAGWTVRALPRAHLVADTLLDFLPDVILSDVRMPGMSGLELLDQLDPQFAPPLVLISAHGDIAMAVEALHNGAYSFVEKPYDPRRLLTILRNAAERHRITRNNQRLKDRLLQLSGLDRVLLGKTPQIANLREEILDVAEADAAVIIKGETGTGKELVARALHDLGRTPDGPFIALNCAALSPDSFEADMFGVHDGSQGRLLAADGGTLFLDEICSCPRAVQAKLLRVIEEKTVLPIGATGPIPVSLRIVSATNEDVDLAIADHRLRADLLFRLNTVELLMPPLRARRDDLTLLMTHFLTEYATVYDVTAPTISQDDLAALLAHNWPGNVRELRHVAERRILAARRSAGSMADAIRQRQQLDDIPDTLREAVAAFERELIAKAIKTHAGRMDATANALGIGRRTLNEKIVKLGLDKDALL
ncbi:MAG: sigma-54-dependent Fis family transcriptional regulator [Yoonia sp.]|nr:sigma-54-dependent Fis family transcriptional regulator [Yoonia sp.]